MFSIIIPTYNSEKTIRCCIDSILTQSFSDFEVLVMDGSSEDNTIPIVNSYPDSRIRVYSERDFGVYDAMNKGIDLAHGDWLYFLGSDDYLLGSDVLDDVARHIEDGIEVIYGDVVSTGLQPEHSGEWSMDKLSWNRCHQAIFYHKKIFPIYGKYNLKYSACADFDLNLKWFLAHPEKSIYIGIPIAHFSAGGFSATNYDVLFHRDFYSLCLSRGRRRLSLDQKIEYTKQARDNSASTLKFWYYFSLYIVYKGIKHCSNNCGDK